MSETLAEPVVAPRPTGFRPDIDGLRAVAILLVVGFHIDLEVLRGGFVGVDVFFVISGYLISRNLFREVDRSGGVALRSFWARRIRRLVPALAVTVVVTLVAASVVLSPLEWPSMAKQGGSSVLYVSNILFALEQGDYFGFELAESPFLHTWSLSVEEQFYLFWPVLFGLLAVAAARIRSVSRQRIVVGALAIVTAGSFLLSLLVTSRSAQWAFFSSPTRAWEFGAGALVAVIPWRIRPAVRTACLVAGMSAVLVAAVTFTSTTAYPGTAALLPVLGTLGIIVAGSGSEPLRALAPLASRPAQWLGRLSYSWYLWHWPFIVLGAIALDDGSVATKAVLALASLGVAAASYKWIEHPMRFHPAFTRSNGRTFVMGASVTLAALAVCVGLWWWSGTAKEDPLLLRIAAAQADTPIEAGPPCSPIGPEWAGTCELGDEKGQRTVLLVGDSQAEQWGPVLDEVGRAEGIRIVTSTLGACPAHDIRVSWSETVRQESPECRAQRATTRRLLDTEPDAVVIADAAYDGKVLADDGGFATLDEQQVLWAASLEAFVESATASGASVGLILDSPQLDRDPTTCVARRRSVDECTVDPAAALATSEPYRNVERRVAADRDVLLFDPVPQLCSDRRCELDSGGIFRYSDQSHLTRTYVLSQSDAVSEFLESLLTQGDRT